MIIALTLFLYMRVSSLYGGLISEFLPTGDEQEEESESAEQEERIRIVEGYKAIYLEDEIITASGIKAEQLAVMSYKPEFTASAEVLNIAPLVSSRTEYLNLLAEQGVLSNELNDQLRILKRAEALHSAKSLTTREMEIIRADYDLKRSRLDAMRTRMDGYTYQVKSNWGSVISNMILDQGEQPVFDTLASNQASLVLVSLLKSQSLENTQQRVFVSSKNKRETAVQASYLDQARQTSNPLFGDSYLYLLETQGMAAGLRLFVWIEEPGDSISGYFVPESAVIWYANEPWIFTRHGNNLFVRKPLGTARKLDNGWLLVNARMEDTRVVTSGGQTLLSEEFKWAIPDEDAD